MGLPQPWTALHNPLPTLQQNPPDRSHLNTVTSHHVLSALFNLLLIRIDLFFSKHPRHCWPSGHWVIVISVSLTFLFLYISWILHKDGSEFWYLWNTPYYSMMTTCQGIFWAVSFNSEIPWNPPLAATLGGIIEQYFGGSGNEVGTRSGCCQDGRAPPHLLLLLLLLVLPRLIHHQHLQLEPHSYHFTPRISASKDVTSILYYSVKDIFLYSPSFLLLSTSPL